MSMLGILVKTNFNALSLGDLHNGFTKMIKPYNEETKSHLLKILQSSKWENLYTLCLYDSPHYISNISLR